VGAIREVVPANAILSKGGEKMPNGFGRRFGSGRGMGFGFRESSPPWPYVGLGRGGLPRCGYFFSGAGASQAWPYPRFPSYGPEPIYAYGPPVGSMSKDEELNYLKDQTEAIKGQLDEIESRMRNLEPK